MGDGSGSDPLLVTEDVRTWFDTDRGDLRAVDGVSVTLDRGRTLGIVGESGCGKTVFARTVLGLLPRNARRAGGRVTFAGQVVDDLDDDRRAALWGVEIAMVLQDPGTSLNPVRRIGAQITESLRLHLHLGRGEATERAAELLRSVGIPDAPGCLRRYPHELSGGMRQRVTIAIALACNPQLLIADEPTTALDVTLQKQILDLLQTLQRQRDMAMILITHDLGVVASRTDEVCVMYAGQVVERAPTAELFAHMRHPYTEALFRSIPRLDQASGTRLVSLPGRPPDLVDPPTGCRFAPRCPYARPRCREETPVLTPDGAAGTNGTGHEHACFFPVGG